jgi:hypothetical protein
VITLSRSDSLEDVDYDDFSDDDDGFLIEDSDLDEDSELDEETRQIVTDYIIVC